MMTYRYYKLLRTEVKSKLNQRMSYLGLYPGTQKLSLEQGLHVFSSFEEQTSEVYR